MNFKIVRDPKQVPCSFIFPTVDLRTRHPTQIYEAIYYVILFLVIYWLKYRYQNNGNGSS